MRFWQSFSYRAPFVCCLGASIWITASCHSQPKLPSKDSPQYAKAVSDFYIGLAALEVGDDINAEQKLSDFTKVVPEEPTGWANWGILALRQQKFDEAAQRLQQARDRAPNNDQIYFLLGVLEGARGDSSKAISDFRKSAQLNTQNLRAIYQLAQEIERRGGPGSD